MAIELTAPAWQYALIFVVFLAVIFSVWLYQESEKERLYQKQLEDNAVRQILGEDYGD